MALHSAEHHQAVEALRGAGATVQMRLWRERMVEPENAVTLTPLRPGDDSSPRERRGPRPPPPESPGPPRQRHVACLVRSERGLGFSIAGGKGSTPYRAGDTVSGRRRPRGPWGRSPRPGSWHAAPPPQGIFISRIAEGGAAHRAGTLQVGDRVLSINGVDMTEARHDHAVSLLTAAAPTIALLLEREAGGPPPPSPPPHSPVPPAADPATVVPASPAGPGPLRLAPSLLTAALEGPYPVEVRPPSTCPPSSHGGRRARSPGPRLCPSTASSPGAPPTPGARPWAGGEPLSWSGGLAPPLPPWCPQEICLPRAGGPLGLSVVGGSDHSSHPFGAQEPGVFISKVEGPRALRGAGYPAGALSRTAPCRCSRGAWPPGAAFGSGTASSPSTGRTCGGPRTRRRWARCCGRAPSWCCWCGGTRRPPACASSASRRRPERSWASASGGAPRATRGTPATPPTRASSSPRCGLAGAAGAGGRAGGRRPEVPLSRQVSPAGAAGRDGRLRVGLRLLEVNQQSLLGLTHAEAVQLLRSAGDPLTVLVCDGFDAPAEVSAAPRGAGAGGATGTGRPGARARPPAPDVPGFGRGGRAEQVAWAGRSSRRRSSGAPSARGDCPPGAQPGACCRGLSQGSAGAAGPTPRTARFCSASLEGDSPWAPAVPVPAVPASTAQ